MRLGSAVYSRIVALVPANEAGLETRTPARSVRNQQKACQKSSTEQAFAFESWQEEDGALAGLKHFGKCGQAGLGLTIRIQFLTTCGMSIVQI